MKSSNITSSKSLTSTFNRKRKQSQKIAFYKPLVGENPNRHLNQTKQRRFTERSEKKTHSKPLWENLAEDHMSSSSKLEGEWDHREGGIVEFIEKIHDKSTPF